MAAGGDWTMLGGRVLQAARAAAVIHLCLAPRGDAADSERITMEASE